MTNQEKDLKNAREYLKKTDYADTDASFCYFNKGIVQLVDLEELLAKHVQWLEQKGEIKFTKNRSKS